MARALVLAAVVASTFTSGDAVRSQRAATWAENATVVHGVPNEAFKCCCSSKDDCFYEQVSSCATPKVDPGKNSGNCKIPDAIRPLLKENVHAREWNMCRTWKKMNTEVLPPSKFGGYAVRVAIPNNELKDLYVAIKTIEFVSADYHMVFKRKSQDSFSFKLVGADGNVASLRFFLGGMELASDGALLDTAKAIASTEKWATRILTLGIAGRGNYASLEDLSLQVDVQMECEFKLDKQGKWQIVPESRKQLAEPKIDNGGFMFWVVNKVIDAYGGVDQIFFDSVWPIVEQMAPPALGRGFQEIPFAAGQIEQKVDFTLMCPGADKKSTRCQIQQMEIKVAASTHFLATIYPLLKKLDSEGFFTQPMVKKLIGNILETYDRNELVFEGADIDITAVANLTSVKVPKGKDALPQQGTKSDVEAIKEGAFKMSPRIKAPIGLLETLIGNALPFKNFLPKNGDPLVAEGSLSIADGTVEGKNMVLDPLTLPYGTGDESIDMRMEVGFKVELEDAGGDPNFEEHMIFSKLSPIVLDVTRMRTSISTKDGFAFNSADGAQQKGQKETVELSIDGEFLTAKLKETGQAVIVPPANVRTAPPESTDGVVPTEYTEPYSTMPTPLDLNEIFESGGFKFSFKMQPAGPGQQSAPTNGKKGDSEVLGFDFNLGSDVHLNVGAKVYSAMMENRKLDYGYFHAFVPGSIHWDNKYKNGIVSMSCGMLTVYVLPGSKKELLKVKPMEGDKLFEIDLSKPLPKLFKYTGLPTEISKAGKAFKKPHGFKSGAYECFQIGEEDNFFTSNDPKWFCSDSSSLRYLMKGIQTQVLRFQTSRWKDTCVPGVNGGHPTCTGKDGTWFQVYNPLDKTTWFPGRPFDQQKDNKLTPAEEWAAAVKTISTRLDK